jgi:outer membrane lipoprotein-sorting protein
VVLNLVSKNISADVSIKINLTFDNKDYLLKNWEIIDELGQSTYLEFTKIRKNISIGSDLFMIK